MHWKYAKGPGFDPRSRQLSLFSFPSTILVQISFTRLPCTFNNQPVDAAVSQVYAFQPEGLPCASSQPTHQIQQSQMGLDHLGSEFQQYTPQLLSTGPSFLSYFSYFIYFFQYLFIYF